MSDTTFVAACATMRSGRDPLANRDAAVRLVREAAEAGADYVQTPEMTSLVERSRQDLFAKVGPEEQDPVLAALRDVARERGVVVHVGSLAVTSGDKVANRAFLIGPRRRARGPLRQGASVRRRPCGRGILAGILHLCGRRQGGPGRAALGPDRHHHLLRRALSRALPRAGGSRGPCS